MTALDAAALFWWMRNRIFYELRLEDHPRILLRNYGDLVTEPDAIVRETYEFVDLSYPGNFLVSGIHSRSRGKGRSVVLADGVEQLCSDMWNRLLGSYRDQRASRISMHSEAV
jgi:hypothetical protein